MVVVSVSSRFATAAAVAVEPRVRQMERKVRSCILMFICLFGDGVLEYYGRVLCG